MKRRVLMIAVAVLCLTSILCVSVFADGEIPSGTYIHTVGGADGLAMTGDWGPDYGKYGGISMLPQFKQYMAFFWSFSPSSYFDAVDYCVILNLDGVVPVSFLIPYEYAIDVQYAPTVTFNEEASRFLVDSNGGTGGVLRLSYTRMTAGAGQYVAFPAGYAYNSGVDSSYNYDMTSNSTCVRITCSASAPGQYAIYFQIRYRDIDFNQYSGLVGPVEDILSDTEARGTLQYFRQVILHSWVAKFVAVMFIGLLLGIIFNFAQSL